MCVCVIYFFSDPIKNISLSIDIDAKLKILKASVFLSLSLFLCLRACVCLVRRIIMKNNHKIN